jgi:hypothetical protein
MDRRQMIAQRVREYFGERLDDVLHMVRQDRQEFRGWQEPAHVRAAVRQAISEGGEPSGNRGSTAVADLEFARTAAEPDRGQQREATGLLLEVGANGLEKVARHAPAEMTAEEVLGLECVLLLYGRPAVLVSDDGSLGSAPPFWNVLEDQRQEIELAQRGVGRIELLGHPEYDWAGTGILVNDAVLLTSRRVAELFCEQRDLRWQFRPGITTWMNYRSRYQSVSDAGYRVRGVIGVHPAYDVALLEVERPQVDGMAPVPLALAAQAPPDLHGRPVYLVGYPVRDARRSEPEGIARVFRDVYNVKRVQPGQLRGMLGFHQVQLLCHDCAPLGQNAGAPVLDFETHQVLGVQTTGRYLEQGVCVPLWVLRDDPLLQGAGVTFTQATTPERQAVAEQLERLARTRLWNEARETIGSLYRRAFGPNFPGGRR